VKVPAFYANTLEGEPPTKWQTLEEHLRGVTERAESFACDFSASLAYWTGLGHRWTPAEGKKCYRDPGPLLDPEWALPIPWVPVWGVDVGQKEVLHE